MAAAQAHVRVANRRDYPGYVNDPRITYIDAIVADPAVLHFIIGGETDHLRKSREGDRVVGDRVYITNIPIRVTFPGEDVVRTYPAGTPVDLTGGANVGYKIKIGGPLPPPDEAVGGEPMVIDNDPIMAGGRRKTQSRRRHQRRKRSTHRRRHTTRR